MKSILPIFTLLIVFIMPQFILNKSLGMEASHLHGKDDKPSVFGALHFMKAKEIWTEIIGFEGYYALSNMGYVKSLERRISHPRQGMKRVGEKILKCGYNPYASVTLAKDGTRTTAHIHIYVATYYVKNPEKKPCVNHKNGDKKDNRAENLEWCTYSENETHSYRVLGKKSNMKNLFHYSKDWEDAITINGYNIRGKARKIIFEMLESGLSASDVFLKGISQSTFYSLISRLKKRGAIRSEYVYTSSGKQTPFKKYFIIDLKNEKK